MKIKIKRKKKTEFVTKTKSKSKNDALKKNKTRNILAYIMCKNHQIKEYHINATRKFNIEDETYVIKGKCGCLKKINGIYEQVYYYIQGNPNPFDLKGTTDNIGLTEDELDNYIGGDIFNILIECQESDKSKYIIHLVCVTFALSIIQFLMVLF